MNNIDLQIENYEINDMVNFIGLNNKYDVFELQRAVDNKLKSIADSNKINKKLKMKLYKFIKQISYRLKDNLNYIHKIQEKQYTKEYKLEHINHQLTDIKQTIGKINNEKNDVVYVNPVNTGLVNQIQRNIITQQISIDTKFRKNYFDTKSTDFVINLATPLKNVVSMKLASLEMANVQHIISQIRGTHSFNITVTNLQTEDISKNITIPSGNYNSTKMVEFLNEELLSINCEILINTNTLHTTIRSKNQNDKLIINFENTINLNAPPMRTLGWLLGFRNRKYEGTYFYTSEGSVDLGGMKYFFLCVNDFKNSLQDVCTILYENSFMRKNILARIPMREGKGAVLFDDNSDKITKKRQYFGPVNIDKLHITLIDEYGITMDLNYNDFSFALEFDVLHEK
tara:strand:- start:1621 stop:2817 length:1197 start_codon:yes stop_codon:yes gene_type:complete